MLVAAVRLVTWLADEGISQGESTIDTEVAESSNPILPVVPELIWAFGSFVVVALLMIFVAVPMVQKGMDARAKKVEEDTDEADRMQAELDELVANYKQKLAEAQAEASRVLDEVRNETAEQQRAARVEVDAELAELRQKTMADINKAKEDALASLRTEVNGLAVDLAERVVAHPLDKQAEASYLDGITKNGSK